MRAILVTGGNGFIGSNLLIRLAEEEPEAQLLAVTREDTPRSTAEKLAQADIVYHLAGSNRPERPDEFYEVNTGFTEEIVRHLVESGRTPPIVFASSTQVERDNHYGRSKKLAEEILEEYARERGGAVVIYRLTNVFGKWAKPNYNSVVATFCHNIARDIPVDIHDPTTELRLLHVDDVLDHFRTHLHEELPPGVRRPEVRPVFETTTGTLAEHLYAFRDARRTLRLPDLSDRFVRLLYSAYLSYLAPDDFAYEPFERRDERGKLTELLKSECFGQIFVSTTRPGVTRGGHYHHHKVEKFCVLHGEATIRFRKLGEDAVLEYAVSGARTQVVDIPPGYVHDIENVGDDEMIVLFWASEVFDPDRPDTRTASVGE
ncbi:MAG: NAD-dependent epimerase/dehydratase family protein [Gemmatimonadota bacterium]